MTSETITSLSPQQVLEEAKDFFTGEGSVYPSTLVDESASHVTMSTFRSRLAISAYPDPAGKGTKVRVSTLRRHDSVGKFLSLIESANPEQGMDEDS
jgi:hypothetical protein